MFFFLIFKLNFQQLLEEEYHWSFLLNEQNSIKDQVQLWTSRINKLNHLLVQLDSPFVQDVLKNLSRNRSPYLSSFLDIKIEITRVDFISFSFFFILLFFIFSQLIMLKRIYHLLVHYHHGFIKYHNQII